MKIDRYGRIFCFRVVYCGISSFCARRVFVARGETIRYRGDRLAEEKNASE